MAVSAEHASPAAWIGRSEIQADTLAPAQAQALNATLDHPAHDFAPGTPLPPLWHWLYFLSPCRQSLIGADGHPQRGGLLPPLAQPRRMFAGAQIEFRTPLRVGQALERRSTVADITVKQGRSGTLAFVRIRHALHLPGESGPVLVEDDDIVYRDARKPGEADPPPQSAPAGAVWRRELTPDEVLLFRYSALTLNGHRIHYDWRYTTEVEGYPGLVVHGPLIATLLLDLVRREAPQADLAAFRFRAVRPTFANRPMRVNGAPQPDGSIRLWAEDHEGWLTMDALATLR